MIEGYRKRLYHAFSMNRSLRYSLYCLTARDPVEIFDWEPLDGDPSKEEREEARKAQAKATEQDYIIMKRFYESQGIDVM